MNRTATLALFFVLPVLAWPTTASAQVIFDMDFSSAAAPAAGWNAAVPTSATHSRTRIAGGGPQGEDVYEMTQISTRAVRDYGGEFYWGWNGVVESTNPAQGARRFYRWRMRFSPNTNFRGVYSSDGTNTALANKLLMVGDGCGSSACRVIVTYRGTDDGTAAELNVVIDGGDSPTPKVRIPVGVWVDVQVEADSASSTSARDGAFKLWVNSNEYSRPTAQITGIALNPINWRYLFLGAYNNHGLQSNGAHSYRLSAFQAAASFDASWSRNANLPSTPNNLRILPPQ